MSPMPPHWRRSYRSSGRWRSRVGRIARLRARSALGITTDRNVGFVPRTKLPKLWTLEDPGKATTLEVIVVILTQICLRPEASRPEIHVIVIVILPRPAYSPVVERGLRNVDVHLIRGQGLAQTDVVITGSGSVVEARLGPVEVSHWNFVGWGRWRVGGKCGSQEKRRWVGERNNHPVVAALSISRMFGVAMG